MVEPFLRAASACSAFIFACASWRPKTKELFRDHHFHIVERLIDRWRFLDRLYKEKADRFILNCRDFTHLEGFKYFLVVRRTWLDETHVTRFGFVTSTLRMCLCKFFKISARRFRLSVEFFDFSFGACDTFFIGRLLNQYASRSNFSPLHETLDLIRIVKRF